MWDGVEPVRNILIGLAAILVTVAALYAAARAVNPEIPTRRRRTRRDWVVSLVYVASVIAVTELADAFDLRWFVVVPFYLLATAATFAYYRSPHRQV